MATVTLRKDVRRIKPGERVPVDLSTREKQLIREHTFADPEYARRLRRVAVGQVRGRFTLEDLDDLRGYVAAEANHTKDKKVGKELDALWDRLTNLMESYDDGEWG